jgi:hypothetical protein
VFKITGIAFGGLLEVEPTIEPNPRLNAITNASNPPTGVLLAACFGIAFARKASPTLCHAQESGAAF